MKYPKFLQEGGTIAFAAPSFGASIEPYNTLTKSAFKRFEEMGYKIDAGPNTFLGEGVGISNTPKKCAEELADYYSNHGDILISVGGGELMCETLGKLDLDAISKADPKWFVGYSDNTHFGFLLATMFDTASVYGPHVAEFGAEKLHESVKDCWSLLTGKKLSFHGYDKWESEQLKSGDNPLASYNLTEETVLKFFNWDGSPIEGRFAGGCLDVLNNMCGTRFDSVKAFNEKYKDEGIIWFIEACEYSAMDIRRSLWHLANAGWFDCAKAFVFGRPLCIKDGPDFCGIDEYVAAKEALKEFNLPIIMDADFGHLPPMMPIINGGYGKLSRYKENNIQIDWMLK